MKKKAPLLLSHIATPLLITMFTIAMLTIPVFNSVAAKQNSPITTQSSWDFDHKLQFKQSQLNNKKFRLEVVPNNKIDFERMAGFLLRKSLKLCQGTHYNLQIVKGIESYNDQEYFPNRLSGSLVAEITCVN